MPNNWNVSYSSITFLENALNGHNKVASFERKDEILFEVERIPGLDNLNIVLVDQYTISKADVIKLQNDFPSMNCVVTAGNWNGYTAEAKDYGLEQNIGVFIISEILGALNKKDVINYVKKDSDGNPIYHYRSA